MPYLIALLCGLAGHALAQIELTPEEASRAAAQVRAVLAAPDETAFLQVLTGVSVLRDETAEAATYDIVASYDPTRYRAPHSGLYPLGFEDQFIHWGKRISLYTRVCAWGSGRFYLNELRSGRQMWIATADARRIHPGPKTLPSLDDPEKNTWQQTFHAVPSSTPDEETALWLRFMQQGTRDAAQFRPNAHPPTPEGRRDSDMD